MYETKPAVKELQRRRQQAITLLKNGGVIREAARMAGSSGSSVVRWCNAHKKGGDKLPSITAGAAVTGCRLFLPLRFRRNARLWGCISLFVPTTLSPMISSRLRKNCCRIFCDGLFWLWIAGWYIAAAPKDCRDDLAIYAKVNRRTLPYLISYGMSVKLFL